MASSNNCSPATIQATSQRAILPHWLHVKMPNETSETRNETKDDTENENEIEAKRNREKPSESKHQTATKSRKKRYFISPLIVKIAHFIAFKVFSGCQPSSSSRRVPVIAEKVCMWQGGTWYAASKAWRQKQRNRACSCRTWQRAGDPRPMPRQKISQLNVMHKSASLCQ